MHISCQIQWKLLIQSLMVLGDATLRHRMEDPEYHGLPSHNHVTKGGCEWLSLEILDPGKSNYYSVLSLSKPLARICHELLSRERVTGDPPKLGGA